MAQSCSSTPAGTCSTDICRRSARGCITAWERSTRTCRSSWCWASLPAIAAAASARTDRAISARSTPACSWRSIRIIRCRSLRPGRMSTQRGAATRVCLPRKAEQPDRGGVSRPTRQLRARIKSYELAFRMQMAVPEVGELQGGERGDQAPLRTRPGGHEIHSARCCLAARRLFERGVRFVQVYHGGAGNAWDSHNDLKKNHARTCGQGRQTDRRPVEGSEAARHAGRNDRGLGHRVRPHAGRRERERTRSPSVRLLHLDGGRRNQARRRPRQHR